MVVTKIEKWVNEENSNFEEDGSLFYISTINRDICKDFIHNLSHF